MTGEIGQTRPEVTGYPEVKICGLRDEETALAVRSLPIDYIGFVFAPSRRRVSPGMAGDIIRSMREAVADGPVPKFAGVFVDPDPAELEAVLRAAPLDIVQLHGAESPQYCRMIRERYGIRVWKTTAVESDAPQEAEERLGPYENAIDGLLLDRQTGGSGLTFPWEAIPRFKRWAASRRIPLIVAGGLHSGNVAELIEQYRPDVVDVSSGVETGGVKDVAKIREFVGRVNPLVSFSG